MKKQVFLLLIFLFLVSFVSADVIINEIMYDPLDEGYGEWIELYNNDSLSIDLTGWSICGSNFIGGYVNHSDTNTYSNTGLILSGYNYAVITDGGTGTDIYDNFTVAANSLALHISTSSICGAGLTNAGDTVILSNGYYSDTINYTEFQITAQGYSLERIDQNGDNTTFNGNQSLIIGGTPGSLNSLSNDTTYPFVYIEFPINNSIFFNNSLILGFNVSDVDSGIQNCTLYLDTTENQTSTNIEEVITQNFTIENLAENQHLWFISCFDNSSNFNQGNSSEFTFNIDTIIPDITTTFPVNGSTYEENILELNWTYSEQNFDSCWYNLNSNNTNTTIDCTLNTTSITVISKVWNNITLWMNDSANNENSSYIGFYVFNNSRPNDPLPVISPIEAYTNDDLNCSFIPLDEDDISLLADISWLKNNETQFTFENNSIFNGTSAQFILKSDNTTKGNTWVCQVRLYDFYNYSNWVNSSELLILNSVPSLKVELPNRTMLEDTNLTNAFDLDNYFTDLDNNTLTYNITGNQSVLVEIDLNNIVSFYPPVDFTGIEYLYFTASDGESTNDSNTFALIVMNVNEKPTINSISDQEIAEDSIISPPITLTASDPDNDPLTFSVTSENISEVDCLILGNLLTLIPSANFTGIGNNAASCTIQVSDSFNTDLATFRINVTQVNDPPLITNFYPETLNPKLPDNKDIIFNVSATDIDNNIISIEWYLDNQFQNIGNYFIFNKPAGTYNVTVIVNDTSLTTALEFYVIVSANPIANTFDGSTTNLALLTESELQNVNLTLEKSSSGKIQFENLLDLRNTVDIDSNIIISNNIVAIDSLNLPIFANQKATITLYNQTYSKKPKIFYSPLFTQNSSEITQECTFCNLTSFTLPPTSIGIVTFSVESFSSFILIEPTILDFSSFSELDSCSNGVKGNLILDIKEPDKNDDFLLNEVINIEAKVENENNEAKDVKVEVVLYDTIKDDSIEKEKSDEIEIEEDDSETFNLQIQVPSDIDQSNSHILYVKAFDTEDEDNNCQENSISIDLKRENHNIIIKNFDMPLIANCNELITAEVEVENLGKNDESDVNIELVSPKLSIFKKSTNFDLDDYKGSDNKNIQDFLFKIPEVESGDYRIDAVVNFETGDNKKTKTIRVNCQPLSKLSQEQASLTAQESLEAIQGDITTIPVKITNNFNQIKTFTIELSNIGDWAEPINTKQITLSPKETSTFYLNIPVKASTFIGKHSATINIKTDTTLISSKDLLIDVKPPKKVVFIPQQSYIPIILLGIGNLLLLTLVILAIGYLVKR